MKTLDPTFQNTIAQPTATITWCWLIERVDGVKLGFTSFDLAFKIDGIEYEPVSGFAPSADSTQEGFKQSDSQNLQGILTSDQISDVDLASGAYQHAKLTCFHVDVTNLPNSLALEPPNFLVVYEGFVGKVTYSDRDLEIISKPCRNGERGIRTPVRFDPKIVFETTAFNHSAISPGVDYVDTLVIVLRSDKI